MWQRGWCGVVVLAALAVPAQGQVHIEWKFKEGDQFYLKNVNTTKQSVEVLGQKTATNMVNTAISSFTVLKKSADSVVLQQKIEDAIIKADGPMAAQQERVAKLMKGTVFTLTLDNQGNITKFEGYDDLVKRLSEGNPDVEKALRVLLSEDTMKQGIREAFAFVPGKPVSKGDTWSQKMALSMGPMGNFGADMKYTYNGPTTGGEAVGYKGDFRFSPNPNDTSNVFPFKVTKGNMKTQRAEGAIVFDSTLGRIASSAMDMHIIGTMTLAINNMEVEMSMDLQMKMEQQWSSTMPKP